MRQFILYARPVSLIGRQAGRPVCLFVLRPPPIEANLTNQQFGRLAGWLASRASGDVTHETQSTHFKPQLINLGQAIQLVELFTVGRRAVGAFWSVEWLVAKLRPSVWQRLLFRSQITISIELWAPLVRCAHSSHLTATGVASSSLLASVSMLPLASSRHSRSIQMFSRIFTQMAGEYRQVAARFSSLRVKRRLISIFSSAIAVPARPDGQVREVDVSTWAGCLIFALSQLLLRTFFLSPKLVVFSPCPTGCKRTSLSGASWLDYLAARPNRRLLIIVMSVRQVS